MIIKMNNHEKEILQALINFFKKQEPAIRHVTFGKDTVDKTNEWIADALQKCVLKIDQTSRYSRINWDRYSEFYIFYANSEDNKEFLIDNRELLFSACKELYVPNGEYDLCDIEIEFNYFNGEELETAPEVIFNKIEEKILSEISNARVCIYIAMAWFTNERIVKVLNKKAAEGLEVSILVDNNKTNKDFFKTIKPEFNLIYADLGTYFFGQKDIVHDKFCIIDLETVMHGTYNWTNHANHNKETFTIDSNRSNAITFAYEFVNLKANYGLKSD